MMEDQDTNDERVRTSCLSTDTASVADEKLSDALNMGVEKISMEESAASRTSIYPDIFSATDYNAVDVAADNVFSQFFSNNPLEITPSRQYVAVALSLYLQASRTHLMTRKFFYSRKIYRYLNGLQSYQKQKEFLLAFENRPLSIDTITEKYGASFINSFDGLRTLENVLKSVLPKELGFSFACISKLSLPLAVKKNTQNKGEPAESDKDLLALNHLVENSLKLLLQQQSTVDLSVIFIDFTAYEILKSKKPVSRIDFPNRIGVTLSTGNHSYQTVGGVYKKHDPVGNTDVYALRVLSRERYGYEYLIHQYFPNTNEKQSVNAVKVSYIEDDDWDQASTIRTDQKKPKSLFPLHLDAKPVNGKVRDDFYLEGVVLSMNSGQEEGLHTGLAFQSVQNSISQKDPVLTCGTNSVLARDIRILNEPKGTNWLSDDIMQAATEKFLGKINKQYHAEQLLYVITPHAFSLAVLNHLVKDTSANNRTGTKNTFYTMGCGYGDVRLSEGYEASKDLWSYKNIYSNPDSWFLCIINYPDQSHWMLLGIHAQSFTYFIYDPMADKGQLESVRSALIYYIDLEGEYYTNAHGVDQNRVKIGNEWTNFPCFAQSQPDKYNCGVSCANCLFQSSYFGSTATNTGSYCCKMEMFNNTGCIYSL
jgi:hypothetical protein